MNIVILTGRIISKPLKISQEDDVSTKVSVILAINSSKKDEADLIQVYFRGQVAEYALTLDKGDAISVEAHLKTIKSEMAEKPYYHINVYGEKITFVSRLKRNFDSNKIEEE